MGDNVEIYQDDSNWYAVWTRSRQEKAVAWSLRSIGVQHYLPLTSETRQWSDRKQSVELPLFSGYLFVRTSPSSSDWRKVSRISGVVSLVGNQTGPLPIPCKEIEAIRTAVAAGGYRPVQPSLKGGDRVRVTRGVLAGIEGRLVRAYSEFSILISIDLIQQSVAVRVSPEDVERIVADPDRSLQIAQSN